MTDQRAQKRIALDRLAVLDGPVREDATRPRRERWRSLIPAWFGTIALAVVIVFWAWLAWGAEVPDNYIEPSAGTTVVSQWWQMNACTEPFPGLPALAARLGVPSGDDKTSLRLVMCDGTAYDPFAIINAVLDRLDKAAVEKKP